jgi:thiamine-monophosphate kinase
MLMIKSEFKLIESIKERIDLTQKFSEKIYGIGDDCAVYKISDDRYGLFSTDISIENVHFDLSYTPLFNAGYRSMAANISDIYAMGGNPVLALISIGIPQNITPPMIDELYDGLLACAVKHGAFIAGGDTSKSSELVINISIYGETSSPVYRKGAKPGDYIYLTGNTGLSKLGLEVLGSRSESGNFHHSILKHLQPEPRGDLTGIILKDYSPASMIDISDGLLIDLGHICEMNSCGFKLFEDKIPAHDELKKFCFDKKIRLTDYSLYSGEEYELLFTSEKDITDDKQITCIGEITHRGYILVTDNSATERNINGYDHFK